MKVKNPEKTLIAYVSTFPPRECGIATFTADLLKYTEELFSGKVEVKVVAMNRPGKSEEYPSPVIAEITEDNKEEYALAAERLNKMSELGAVVIQHEFGIFGPNYGENLLIFLEKIQKPVMVTFHTVLPEPAAEMKQVVERIIAKANVLVVMTKLSKKLLVEVYNAPAEKIQIIPHGIHPQLYANSEIAKNKLKLENKRVLSTFGLLGRGKGIEYAIRAMPKIVEKYGDVVYLVLGGTHPVVLKNEGEAYREELMALAKELGVEDHIVFYNKYLSIEDLLLYLEATDIYLSMSQNPNQAVSGTLTYALGAGRAVISTAFLQAKEIITPEVGALVGFGEYESVAEEVIKLFKDEERLLSMGKTAYFRTRNMTWSNVALSYMRTLSLLAPNLNEKNKSLFPVKIDYLQKLTDDFGILQFASMSNPDPDWGYTVDDNARALVAISWYHQLHPRSDNESLIHTYLQFIERAALPEGGFVNYFNKTQDPHPSLNQNENLEDANARTLWALAVASVSNIPANDKAQANDLFKKQFSLHENVSSPRAAAFYIKAFTEYALHGENKGEIFSRIKSYADYLVDLYRRTREEKWHWFEEGLTYSNGVLPEALLAAYNITQHQPYFDVAKEALDFLLEHSFEGDVCVPVGQAGWFQKGYRKEKYDQQPEEVSALILALHQMVLVGGDEDYMKKKALAFDWFMGNNLSQQVVYTHFTGGSYDGINKEGINLNQGAESTVSYLLARLVM